MHAAKTIVRAGTLVWFWNGEPHQLGQTRRIGFVFLPPDSAAIFKSAGKYLWEGRIIGEAVVQR